MSLHKKQFEYLPGTDFDLHLLHCLNQARYPYLLQTVVAGSTGDQYDILFAFPAEKLLLDRSYRLYMQGTSDRNLEQQDFLSAFDAIWHQQSVHVSDSSLPFTGGWFVYLAYELAQQIEPTLNMPTCDIDLPISFATRIPAAIIKDHTRERIIAIAEADHEDQFKQLCEDIEALQQTTSAETSIEATTCSGVNDKDTCTSAIAVSTVTEDPAENYLDAVKKIKHYIRDGDVFQVNLSRQWCATLASDVDHNQLYRQLRENNPAPFFGLVTWNNKAIISSSPERLVRVIGERVETRPIAGTRPRSNSTSTDTSNKSELIAHPKERAEHIMLIDLERNDLGRVCKPGSVKVNELMALESYAHVHHIVSNVCGELRNGVTPGQVLQAVFPGGTITGCPKVRCMEIIAELEQTGRGAYTGSIGYINHNGNMDFNILIRTMVKDADQLYIRAGAGIVADSIAEKELEETRAKARGLLLALGIDTIC